MQYFMLMNEKTELTCERIPYLFCFINLLGLKKSGKDRMGNVPIK